MWFPYLNLLSEKNGEIVFQKLLSTFEHLSSKYLRMEFLQILTTKFLRRLFSSQEDFLYFLNLFLAMFLRYWAFLRAEFIYGTDCDETVLLLTGAWWSTTYLMRELVYHAMDTLLNDLDPLLDLHQAGQCLVNTIQPGWDLAHLLPHNLLDGSNEAGINSYLLILLPRLGLPGGILFGHSSSMLRTVS